MKRCVLCGDTFLSADWNCPGCGGSPPRSKGFVAFAPEASESNDGFSPSYFSRLVDLEAGHFWFEGRNQVILWGLRRYAREARSLMEVGCGTGVVLQAVHRDMPNMHLCGSEIFSNGLPFAAQRLPEADLMQMDARKMPFDAEFDAIGLFDVLEHIEDDRVVLRETWRSLKPGGCVLITVPQHPSLWSAVDEHSYHKRRYVAKELIAKLVEADFEILHITSFMTLLLPIFVLSRLHYRGLGRKLSPGEALEIHPLLNGLFSKILACERLLIQLGLKLPAGGSLFAVARRPPAAEK
ncbi:MAG: class I SAM-dependent methyltransferase [Acidobacteriia bacterium]|nr:class I SAM-dependent methyltransferase [Terriglobia bacterium]